MNDFMFSNVEDYIEHVGRKYGWAFVRRNRKVLRALFSTSRALTYTKAEYETAHNRIVSYVGTTGDVIETQGCVGVTN